MPINLLQIIPELETGGAERTTLEIADAIVKDGGKAIVFSNGGRMTKELEGYGAKLAYGNAKSKNPWTILITNTIKICDIIKSNNISILHARSRAPAISAFLAAKFCNIPLVTTYHGIYNATSHLKRFYNGIMTKGARIIANSNYTKAHLVKEHKIDPDRVSVIYRGVDLIRFNPSKISKKMCDEKLVNWGLSKSARTRILLPARLTNWKGQKVLIEAASILANRGIFADYVFAGEDQGRAQYTEELVDLIRKYKLDEMFHLIGHESDIPTAMMACDIIVTPSIEPEAFGRTAAEAGAMGRPVIASNLGGAKEVVSHKETGFLIEAGDFVQLAKYIEQLIEMGSKGRDDFGAKAKERVCEMFPTSALQQKTLQLYYELLNPIQ